MSRVKQTNYVYQRRVSKKDLQIIAVLEEKKFQNLQANYL